MIGTQKIATIFGGTGFLGRQIVRELAHEGYLVKIATRIPESAYFLKPFGNIGQIVPVICNYNDAQSVAKTIKNSDVVINCIGILFERGKKSKFQRAHVDIPALIAKTCAQEQVKRFVHISALGCDVSTSRYAKSKLEGEKAVLENFPKATIFRPSVIFGEDDNFFNMFAELTRYSPFLPLIGGGKTKFQPVYVGDVADAVLCALTDEKTKPYQGKVFQLGGDDVLSFKEIYEKIFEITERRCVLLRLPFWLAKIQAVFLSILPKPLLTPDQVESLKTDNVVESAALGFQNLGIRPKSMDLVLPKYLERYRSGGRFSDLNVAS